MATDKELQLLERKMTERQAVGEELVLPYCASKERQKKDQFESKKESKKD